MGLTSCKLKYSDKGWCCFTEQDSAASITGKMWKRASDYFASEEQARHWAVNNGCMVVGKI